MNLIYPILCCAVILIAGCSIEQQQVLGANSNREDGFSGYGTMNVRAMEGPLMDMMVPDNAPKGRADATRPVAEKNVLMSGERNLSWNNQGINRDGARILSNRPGTLRNKYMLRDKPHLSRSVQFQTVQTGSLEQEIERAVEQIETVEHAVVVVTGTKTFIGVKSTESNRQKLREEIRETVSPLTFDKDLYIATDRNNVRRIRSLQGARGPLDKFNNQVSPLISEK